MTASPTDAAKRTGPLGWIRRMYDWVLAWADHPAGPIALFVLSFVESSFFPIPPDPLLIALCLGAVTRSFGFAALCTVASVLGGLFGYLIGMFAFDQLALPILEIYGKVSTFEELREGFRDSGSLAVFGAALTPIPYKLVTIASGAAGLSVPVFVVASLLGRGMRFFALAALIWWKGAVIGEFIEKHFEKLTVLFGVLFVGGFVLFRYLLAH